MPKYEDFKVGDVWICRDGSKRIIGGVEPLTLPSGGINDYPIRSVGEYMESVNAYGEVWHRPNGKACGSFISYDLISKVVDEPEAAPAGSSPRSQTLRDELALAAINGFLSGDLCKDNTWPFSEMASAAYEVADAMMEARKIEGVTA